jgi:tetratricopeptide (TPR) repeat protein
MKVFRSTLTLTAVFALLSTGIVASGQSADELIKKGDLHYDRLEADKALKYYLPAEKLEPDNASLLVRIARQYRHLMSDATKKHEKLNLGRTAVDYSRRAAVLAPNDAEAQLALAISYGKILPMVGNKEKVESSRLIKSAAEKVVKLDPKNDLGWHVLGRWHVVLAEVTGVRKALAQVVYGKMPTATNEAAVKCFEKAIELNPTRLMHYIELGRTYAQMDRKDEARKFINKGLGMKETEKDDPETKQKGREILAKLK